MVSFFLEVNTLLFFKYPRDGSWVQKQDPILRLQSGHNDLCVQGFCYFRGLSTAMSTRITPPYANDLKWRLTGQIGVNMRALTHLHYGIQAPSVIT